MNPVTGKDQQSQKCRLLSCDHCIHTHIFHTGLAIRTAAPNQMVTVTGLPLDVMLAADQLTRVLRVLRDKHGVEYCAALEINPNGTGAHAHVLAHGPYLRQSGLREVAARAGVGHIHVERIRITTASGGDYVMKEARQPELRAAFLKRNGGRLLRTSSRGFWRDGVGGPLLGGRTGAAKVIRHRRRQRGATSSC